MRIRRPRPGDRNLSRRLPLLAVALLLLSSCALPGNVPETVKIGLSAPFEGFYRDLGYEALYAVRLAVRQRNEAGGVGAGRLVELVALNDLNESQESVTQAAEMAVDPGILGVLGGLSPRTAGAAASEYQRRGVPFLAPAAGAWELGEAAARFAARQLGVRSAAILCGTDEADVAQAGGFAGAFRAAGGAVRQQIQPRESAAVAAALAEMGEVPDALFLAGETSRAAEWIEAARASGFGGAILGGPEVGSPLTVRIAGAASEGVLYVSALDTPPDDPAFRSAYEELSGGAAPGPVAAWCYSAAQRLLDAIDQAERAGAHPLRKGVSSALAGQGRGEAAIKLYVIRDGQAWVAWH